MPFQIVRDNIVHMHTDAIVNAANVHLQAGGGVCGAIFDAAGHDPLQKACDAIGHCDAGDAVITPGFRLPAKYIIHAVGPIWRGGGQNEEALLRACYTKALNLAREHGLASIAFPLISSGIYGYPKDQALQLAISAIGAFLLNDDMSVYLVVYDQAAYQLSGKLFASIQSYIDDHYVHSREEPRRLRRHEARMHGDAAAQEDRASETNLRGEPPPMPMAAPSVRAEEYKKPDFLFRASSSLQSVLKKVPETFSESVLMWIDRKHFEDVSVYKKANLDRKLFSKLRSNRFYAPSKQTAIALCVALELTLEESRDLLARAGYALSPCNRFDLIVSYFISKGNYNIFEINQALFAFDEQLLGA